MRRALTVLLLLSAAAYAKEPPKKEPGPKSKGKIFAWQTQDGLQYLYRVPKSYDPEKGANVVFFIHGTNMNKFWGMYSHNAKTFRPDDILISPEGTTKNPNGRFTFYGQKKDVDRMRALHEEIKAAFKIRACFLYGHSNGGFFSCLYASMYPSDVQGVLSHAGGVWSGTQPKSEQHHCALAFMNGTDDPLMPVTNAVGGALWYRKEGYPKTHFRVLEGHAHKPSHFHAVQQLAWCEAMTSDDPVRVVAAYLDIAGVKDRQWIDFSALYAVAKRLAEMEAAPEAARNRGKKAMAALDKLATAHVAAIKKAMGKNDGSKLDGKPWMGYLPRFLLDFDGVPARDELYTEWEDTLKAQEEAARPHIKRFYELKGSSPANAFSAVVEAMRVGYLHFSCYECELPGNMSGWRKNLKKALDKDDVKTYDLVMKARKDGLKQYSGLNRKFKAP